MERKLLLAKSNYAPLFGRIKAGATTVWKHPFLAPLGHINRKKKCYFISLNVARWFHVKSHGCLIQLLHSMKCALLLIMRSIIKIFKQILKKMLRRVSGCDWCRHIQRSHASLQPSESGLRKLTKGLPRTLPFRFIRFANELRMKVETLWLTLFLYANDMQIGSWNIGLHSVRCKKKSNEEMSEICKWRPKAPKWMECGMTLTREICKSEDKKFVLR